MKLTKTVSVIIPCRNEENFIQTTIDRVFEQDYPSELLEVLIADGMSTDKTRDIIEENQKKRKNLQLVLNTKLTVPNAFNITIPTSKGEIIVILGAHSDIPPNYISGLVSKLIELDAANVGAVMESLPPDDSLKSLAIAHACSKRIGMGNSMFRIGAKHVIEVDTVPFGCYPREIFEKVGLFDTDLTRNQDDEFNARVKRSGGKIFLIPEIKFTYYTRNSYSKLWTMFFQYGLFKPLVNRKIGIPSSIRQFAPMLLVLSLSLLLCASFIHPIFPVLLLAELSLYYGLIFISAITLPKRNSFALIIHFVLSIQVIHFAYGIGYLKGIWKFLILNQASQSENINMSR